MPFPVHVHMLRPACGYALANKGMGYAQAPVLLGHASITNTVRYSAMSPEPFRDFVAVANGPHGCGQWGPFSK